MVCVGRKAQGHLPGKPSLQTQGVERGVDQGGIYLSQSRTAQGADVFIPTAVLHVLQAVLNPPVAAEHLKQFLWPALAGTQAAQQIPALPAHLPGGRVYGLLLHHRPLPRPGESQLIPDIAAQCCITPDPSSLGHPRFFPGSQPAPLPLPHRQTRRSMPPAPQAGFP